jgi:hypothetical protein
VRDVPRPSSSVGGDPHADSTSTRRVPEPDDRARVQQVYEAVSGARQLPPDELTVLALQDPSHEIRFLALQALGGESDARTVATAALNDPHPHVRSKAQEILDALDAAVAPVQPAEGR